MKKNIIFAFLLLFGFSSCEEFLEVSSSSKNDEEYVFGSIDEMSRVLTAVYAPMLSSYSYGNVSMSSFALNNDVEFTTFTSATANVSGSEFRRFDGGAQHTDVYRYWTYLYQGIERANIFIDGALESPVYDESDPAIQQMIGEAKTIRAMYYHDLVVLFGDIPFSTVPSMTLGSNFVIPVEDRNVILDFCIDDLIDIAPKMTFARDLGAGVKRASKEFAYGLIARIALTRGGYALYPDKTLSANTGTMERPSDYLQYYEIAREYSDAVIASGTHRLSKSFRAVFIDECNYISTANDDPIFEIPFLQNSSGNVGYIHGPYGEWTNNTTTGLNVWGVTNPSSRLNAFYRYSFDREDHRLEYTNGLWYYQTDGTPQIRADYYVYNNKWSKFWTNSSHLNLTISPRSSGNTGIAYPYMRYAEILLIYAEAVNELENGVSGPNGSKAKEALRQVRERAFRSTENYAVNVDAYIDAVSGSKEDFFEAIFNERKWEFGGENMRWKDLVRWNLYGKVILESFMDYYIVSGMMGGDYYDLPPFSYQKWENIPPDIFYRRVENPQDINVYPNTTLQILELHNPYELEAINPGTTWTQQPFYRWWNETEGQRTAQILYSFRGYVRDGEDSNYQQLISLYPDNLPPVRYILPFPQDVINRSSGKYKNYYGY